MKTKVKINWIVALAALLLVMSIALIGCAPPDPNSNTQHIVIFSADGGTAVADVKVKNGEKITKPADPTKDGFVFGGWYKEAALTTAWNFDTDTVTAKTTLYAKWTATAENELVEYTVSFNSNGGDAVESITVKSGEKITKPADPTKPDFNFEGWYKESAHTSAWNFDSDTVTADMTLYANWTVVKTYTVTFYSEVGIVFGTPQKVKHGQNATAPTGTPTKSSTTESDFIFAGWDKEFTNIMQDIDIIAKFNQAPHNVKYTLDGGGNTYTVTGVSNKNVAEVAIHGLHNGKAVVAIANSVFSNYIKLTSITIPNSVTSIGSGVFKGCNNLKSITIPSGVENIAFEMFSDCTKLENVTILGNLTSIEMLAFFNCNSLKSINIPGDIKSIGMKAFSGCNNITSFIIPSGVTEILTETFKDCFNLSSVTILGNLTSIGDSAFEGCKNLKSIIIPNSVTTIGDAPFRNCEILTIYLEATSTQEGWASNWNGFKRPVVWGCVLSADKSYVASFTKTKSNIQNVIYDTDMRAPYRTGYEFGGWTKTSGSLVADYTAGGVFLAENDITLYAIWTKTA